VFPMVLISLFMHVTALLQLPYFLGPNFSPFCVIYDIVDLYSTPRKKSLSQPAKSVEKKTVSQPAKSDDKSGPSSQQVQNGTQTKKSKKNKSSNSKKNN